MLVSVLMPTYNHGRYIASAIESYLSQTGVERETELLIGNDASTDDTLNITQEYARKYPDRIRLFSYEKNRGLIANYRFLIAQARGKYLAVLESDDYWIDPCKLAKQTAYMEQHENCGLVFTAGNFIDQTGKTLGIKRENTRLLPQKKAYEALIFSNFILAVTTCFRKSLVEKYCDLEDFVRNGFVTFDYPVWIALARRSDFYAMEDVTACYRVTENSISNNNHYRKREAFLLGIDKIIEYSINKLGYEGSKEHLINERITKHMMLALAFGKYERYFYFCKQIKPMGMKWSLMRYCPFLFMFKKWRIINSGAVSALAKVK